jgi:hypothetical protein
MRQCKYEIKRDIFAYTPPFLSRAFNAISKQVNALVYWAILQVRMNCFVSMRNNKLCDRQSTNYVGQ